MSDPNFTDPPPESRRTRPDPSLANSDPACLQQDEREAPPISNLETARQLQPADHPLLAQLRPFTTARIALGRTGSSLPTRQLLDFSAAHARARDAVHAPFHAEAVAAQLAALPLQCLHVYSAAHDRPTYLRRPDLGRSLHQTSRELLAHAELPQPIDLLFVIADGLSARAAEQSAAAVVYAGMPLLKEWKIGPVLLAHQARVALGDEAGELLRAEAVVVLIGERPGLSSPESLGIYLTYQPRVGRTDAERNCISNIHRDGVTPAEAADTLSYLLQGARRLGLSGVLLKDEQPSTPTKLLR